MTLDQIEERLGLFPEYLKYYIDKHVPELTYPQDLMRNFRLTGVMFYHWEETHLLSFNGWLKLQGKCHLSENGK